MQRALRWQLAAVSLGAAAIHFVVIVPHLNEYRPFGYFILVVAWFQAVWAVFVAEGDDRRMLVVGLAVNAVVIAIWVWSRTAGLPIGPEPGTPEEIGTADTISTAFEAVIILGTTLLLAANIGWRELSRRIVVGSALFVWAVAILLTSIAILGEAEGAPAGH